MLTISPKSYQAFSDIAEAQFTAKLAQVVREAVPDLATEPEPAFSAQIHQLVEQARSYGLCTEQTIGAFAITAGLLGTDFVKDHPAVKQILSGNESEFRKAELLEAFTLELFQALDQ